MLFFFFTGYFDFDAYSLMVFAPKLEILPYLKFFFKKYLSGQLDSYTDSFWHHCELIICF